MLYRKKDLFGSDGIAMNGSEIIFWNSKATVNESVAKSKLVHGAHEFDAFKYPPFVKRWLVVWEPVQVERLQKDGTVKIITKSPKEPKIVEIN